MKHLNKMPVTCPQCGHEHPATLDTCPNCGKPAKPVEGNLDAHSEWARGRDSLKTTWVASVIAFWVSASILGIVFFIENKLNLILVSIALGMLLIGVWLKTRYQLHLRKEPDRQSKDAQSD
ncbi:MAG: hypothetical protein WBM81_12490 [Sedimenticolaceae bacterium]